MGSLGIAVVKPFGTRILRRTKETNTDFFKEKSVTALKKTNWFFGIKWGETQFTTERTEITEIFPLVFSVDSVVSVVINGRPHQIPESHFFSVSL